MSGERKKFLRVVMHPENGIVAEFLPARDMSLPRLLLSEHELSAELSAGLPWDAPDCQERVALKAIDARWRRLANAGNKAAKIRMDAKAAAKTAARAGDAHA